MTQREGKRVISIVTACMNTNGSPAFALNNVEVTPEEIENGVHFYLAEAQLLEDGYEEPFVHFAEDEAFAFLLPMIQQHIVLAARIMTPSEKTACPASSN